MSAPTVRKFTFDLRFDEPEDPGQTVASDLLYAGPTGHFVGTEADEADYLAADGVYDAEPEPPPPLYTEEEMELAREEAYVAGHTAALEEASAALEQAMVSALTRCAEGIAGLKPGLERATGEIAELAAQVALAVCRKLLPHTGSHYAAAEITALVAALMPELHAHPRLMLRVHPQMVPLLRDQITQVAQRAGFEGRIVTVEDPSMVLSDARLEWADGGAERNTTRLWDQVEELVERNIPRFTRGEALDLPEPDADAAPDPVPEPAPTPPVVPMDEDVWPAMDTGRWYQPPPIIPAE
ncbi:FliH/SctL family protein [Novispirillum itersonii]|uniref:Flagellar assembly protein FliH n=1 Tax=Novispirillum itersonii TaxID=189 RepID=A0A7W9ZBY1_NOVIT|nr:FliH/SctL family protein [Novispirillum itersonii]MBB6208658.1 flagellar assembly protein FliH [Novispirillum itersonii]